ncbi:protein TESPA1, partial [Myiozetetes cayanensis]|uniref:protein TESPA1 n=1 Tax=Myiozetetes cayanensis TaxID=478635 RepID=UPI00215ECED7
MASRVPPGVPRGVPSRVPWVPGWGPWDAEEILSDLGFVGSDPGGAWRVPPRFFSAPSRANGIDFQLFLRSQARRLEMEDPGLLLAGRFQPLQALAATADPFFGLCSHASRTPERRIGSRPCRDIADTAPPSCRDIVPAPPGARLKRAVSPDSPELRAFGAPKTGGGQRRGRPHGPRPPGTPLRERRAEESGEMEEVLSDGRDDGRDDGDSDGDNDGDDAHKETSQPLRSFRVSIRTQTTSTWLWSSHGFEEGSVPLRVPPQALRVSIRTQTSSTWLWSSHSSSSSSVEGSVPPGAPLGAPPGPSPLDVLRPPRGGGDRPCPLGTVMLWTRVGVGVVHVCVC